MIYKLEKDSGLEMLEIAVLFSYRKLISNCWYYLAVSLDKISNNKNCFENDESF